MSGHVRSGPEGMTGGDCFARGAKGRGYSEERRSDNKLVGLVEDGVEGRREYRESTFDFLVSLFGVKLKLPCLHDTLGCIWSSLFIPFGP